MAKTNEIFDFIEDERTDVAAGATVLVCEKRGSAGIGHPFAIHGTVYRCDAKAPDSLEMRERIKYYVESGGSFPFYLVRVGTTGKVLNVREVNISAWMEKQQEKSLQKRIEEE